MTLDIYTLQNQIMAHISSEVGVVTFDTNFPELQDEPTTSLVLDPYCVVRSNDLIATATGGSFGGARFGEYYTLLDVLCIGATPEDARELAQGAGGVNDTLIGWVPNANCGEMTKRGGGQVYTLQDGSSARPSRFVARCSFRVGVNFTITETA